MPHSENETIPAPHEAPPSAATDEEPSFPPVTRNHILHCSYDYWFPKYRTSCIRSKIIRLNQSFIDYLHEDGILLADDDEDSATAEEDDWEPSGPSSDILPPPNVPPRHQDLEDDSDSDIEDGDDPSPKTIPPNKRFPELHRAIQAAIAQLGGEVAPKLNWSSPQDAAFISRMVNTMKCTTANDVYTLLKSSSFITHDLDHAFDGTVPTPSTPSTSTGAAADEEIETEEITFHPILVLRASFEPMRSMEFRCFVKARQLVAVSARDLNYYPFLQAGRMRAVVLDRVRTLFGGELRDSFPDECFVFDVYIPNEVNLDEDDDEEETEHFGRARLIDINPWAPRTDSLLFRWSELLALEVPRRDDGDGGSYETELRVVDSDDPAAFNFSSSQYSAHKLPKEVVDASMAGPEALRNFARQWQRPPNTGVWEINGEGI